MATITTGTPKQIDWAAKIKTEMLNNLTITVQDMGNKRARMGKANNADAVLAILTPILSAQTDAAWWIEHRDTTAPQLALSLATAADKAAIQSLS